jgi:metal-responsive CopG/Arc/MetJ family transcriptional regulator
VLTLRLPTALRSAVESWARQQNDKPSRSEAIRRLLEVALATKAKSRNPDNK